METKKFTLDIFRADFGWVEEDICFEGIDLGKTWNGWACPMFEKEVADELMKVTNDINSWKCFDVISYNAENDCYYSRFEEDDEFDVYEATVIDGETYYPIGAYCWVWEIVDEEER